MQRSEVQHQRKIVRLVLEHHAQAKIAQLPCGRSHHMASDSGHIDEVRQEMISKTICLTPYSKSI